MTEELEVLQIVAGRLEAAQIPYMVTGSIAANYYAVPRMTRDIDLVVELSPDDAERVCATFEPISTSTGTPCGPAIVDRTGFNLVHTAKLDWARDTRSEVQLADVRNLLACADLDREYLARWVTRLGLSALYREVAK